MNTHKLLFRAHDSNATKIRVWRETWTGDTFEILTKEEFNELKTSVEKLKVFLPFLDLTQAEDDDITVD